MVVTGAALRRWTAGLLVVTGLMVTASGIVHLTARKTAWHDLYSYLTLSGEYNLPAQWNAALLLLVSVAALVSGLLTGRGVTRWGWFVVGAVTLLMSVDEATQIHERTADLVTRNPLPTFPWVVVGVPLAVLLVTVLVLATWRLERPVRRRLGLALALYILGALVLEALSGYYWRQQRPNVSELFGTVEELLEMVACIYAAHVIVGSWLPMRITVRATEKTTGSAGATAPATQKLGDEAPSGGRGA